MENQTTIGMIRLFSSRPDEENDTMIDNLSDEIMDIYPEGLKSIIRTPKPKEDEPAVIMILNCPESFTQKYFAKEGIEKKHYTKISLLKDIISKSPHDSVNFENIKQQTNGELDNVIRKQNQETSEIKTVLKELFENLSSLSDQLIEAVILNYINRKIVELKRQNLPLYNRLNTIYQLITQSERSYYYLNYHDLLFLFCSMLSFYTGLFLLIDFTDNPNVITLVVYGNENRFNSLADYLKLSLQLKPYALKYQSYCDKNEKKTNKEDKDIKVTLLNEQKWISLNYNQLEIDNPLHWPPYFTYESNKDEKYRRYNKDDTYHECNIHYDSDELCTDCSKYRNIDKLRLIYDSLDKVLKIKYLAQAKILEQVIFKRNYKSYQNKLTVKNVLFKNWNVFNQSIQMEWISLIRNFYGEQLSYYFLWLTELIKWSIIPAFFGIIISIATMIFKYEAVEGIDMYEVLMLMLCLLITLWASSFLRAWRQKEAVYNYIWGMESFKSTEPDSETFQFEQTQKLIFNHNFPYVSPFVKKGKQIISYLVLFAMGGLTCGIVFFLFWLKKECIQRQPLNISPGLISMGFAAVNTFQIKLMSNIYTRLATKLTEWENYQKDFQKTNSFIMKKIIFDFINSYISLFYIAFFKHFFNDHCITIKENGIETESCLSELKIQLYTTFTINLLVLNMFEITIPFCNMKKRINKIKNDLNQKTLEETKGKISKKQMKDEIPPYSIEHQLICDSWTEAIADYTEMIIAFGYICLFSVAAPLTPVIVLGLMYFEKFVDGYKIVFLVRVDSIKGTTGIEKYKKILQFFIYIGMLTNVALVVFVDNNFLSKNDFNTKALIFALVEIIIFLLSTRMKRNNKPYWFEYLNDIKDLYDKEYYQRNVRALPHFELVKTNIHEKESTPIINVI